MSETSQQPDSQSSSTLQVDAGSVVVVVSGVVVVVVGGIVVDVVEDDDVVLVVEVVEVVVVSGMQRLSRHDPAHSPHSSSPPQPSPIEPHSAPSVSQVCGRQQTPNLSPGLWRTQMPGAQLLLDRHFELDGFPANAGSAVPTAVIASSPARASPEIFLSRCMIPFLPNVPLLRLERPFHDRAR
jgi:hypothetical protein